MNGELPPIDPELRDQLARRSAGRLPGDLVADVSAAVDAVAVERPRRVAWRAAAFGAPRLGAAVSLALVVMIGAALLALPRLATAPAGTANYTALTTAELASLLAATTQPAVNTTLVATVTVDSRNDVCPMNRYPTLGVVEGMESQVCVMGYDLNTYLSSDRVSAPKVSGTFAFRYLAPGYLGLIGELTLPSTGITYRATDEWPLQGRPFLVDGWLGADELTESCVTTQPGQPAGDVLLPNGDDCPYDNWLGTQATAPGIAADHEYTAGSTSASYDPLALWGNARHVEAGGMRIIDGIDHEAPIHGVYVVRSVTAQCPYSSPIDSRGCGVWRVLARVSDTSLHAPTATPTPSPAPVGAYPADRALTTDELGRLLAGPAPAVNTALVASVTIDPQPDACPMNSRPTYGVIHGIEPQVCVVGPIGDTGSVASGQNVFAFRYIAPGVLGLLGLVQPASSSKLTHAAADDWLKAGKVILVDGWLRGVPYSCPAAPPIDPTPTPDTGGDPLNPEGSVGEICQFDWLSEDPAAISTGANGQVEPPVGGQWIHAGGAVLIDRMNPDKPTQGVFVVETGAGVACEHLIDWRPGCPLVLAKLADLTIPTVTPSSTATPAPTATPTVAPPATPLIPPGGSPIGLFGEGNRPLTVAEFASLWESDPARLAGRIVVVKGPVSEDLGCSEQSVTPNGAACGTIAPEGPWVVSVGSGGKVSVLGALATPTSGFVWTVDGAKAASGPQAGQIIAVDALLEYWFNFCDIQRLGGCSQSWLVRPDDNILSSIEVQEAACGTFASNPAGNPAKIRGVYLLRVGEGNSPWTLLSRLEPATLP